MSNHEHDFKYLSEEGSVKSQSLMSMYDYDEKIIEIRSNYKNEKINFFEKQYSEMKGREIGNHFSQEVRKIIYCNHKYAIEHLIDCTKENKFKHVAKYYQIVEHQQQKKFTYFMESGCTQMSEEKPSGLMKFDESQINEALRQIKKGAQQLMSEGIYHIDLCLRNSIKVGKIYKIFDFDKFFVFHNNKKFPQKQRLQKITFQIFNINYGFQFALNKRPDSTDYLIQIVTLNIALLKLSETDRRLISNFFDKLNLFNSKNSTNSNQKIYFYFKSAGSTNTFQTSDFFEINKKISSETIKSFQILLREIFTRNFELQMQRVREKVSIILKQDDRFLKDDEIISLHSNNYSSSEIVFSGISQSSHIQFTKTDSNINKERGIQSIHSNQFIDQRPAHLLCQEHQKDMQFLCLAKSCRLSFAKQLCIDCIQQYHQSNKHQIVNIYTQTFCHKDSEDSYQNIYQDIKSEQFSLLQEIQNTFQIFDSKIHNLQQNNHSHQQLIISRSEYLNFESSFKEISKKIHQIQKYSNRSSKSVIVSDDRQRHNQFRFKNQKQLNILYEPFSLLTTSDCSKVKFLNIAKKEEKEIWFLNRCEKKMNIQEAYRNYAKCISSDLKQFNKIDNKETRVRMRPILQRIDEVSEMLPQYQMMLKCEHLEKVSVQYPFRNVYDLEQNHKKAHQFFLPDQLFLHLLKTNSSLISLIFEGVYFLLSKTQTLDSLLNSSQQSKHTNKKEIYIQGAEYFIQHTSDLRRLYDLLEQYNVSGIKLCIEGEQLFKFKEVHHHIQEIQNVNNRFFDEMDETEENFEEPEPQFQVIGEFQIEKENKQLSHFASFGEKARFKKETKNGEPYYFDADQNPREKLKEIEFQQDNLLLNIGVVLKKIDHCQLKYQNPKEINSQTEKAMHLQCFRTLLMEISRQSICTLSQIHLCFIILDSSSCDELSKVMRMNQWISRFAIDHCVGLNKNCFKNLNRMAKTITIIQCDFVGDSNQPVCFQEVDSLLNRANLTTFLVKFILSSDNFSGDWSLANLTSLENLFLYNCESVTDKIVETLSATARRNMKELSLERCKVTTDCMTVIAECQQLKRINLSRTDIDIGRIAYFQTTHLNLLKVCHCQQLNHVNLKQILDRNRDMVELIICWNKDFQTDLAFDDEDLLDKLPRLEKIHVWRTITSTQTKHQLRMRGILVYDPDP